MPRLHAQRVTIPIHKIGVDERNPRLPPQQSQREAIRAMIEQQGEKIVHLAADITEHGLSEAERFMAIVPDNQRFPYVSLDGNRRLVALKLLQEPTLADGVLSGRWFSRLLKIAELFAKDPIKEVELAVFDSREHGALWVARRHSVNLNGIGQDPWDAMEKHRFDAWRGVASREWQVLQFVHEHGNLSPADVKRLPKVPMSTLLRLIGDSYVKEQLGLEYRNNLVVTNLPNEEVIKPLRRIILDLLDRKEDVTTLDSKADRKRYIDNLALTEKPSSTASLTHFHRLGQKERFVAPPAIASKACPEPLPVAPKSAFRKLINERTTIAPSSCQLAIGQPRIQDIYQELQQLDITAHATAGAVLLRLFVELSLDHFLARLTERIEATTSVAEKLEAAAKYFSANGSLGEDECVYMRKISDRNSVLLPNVDSLSVYVHTQVAAPLPADLRQQWDALQPILRLIWS
ncbi:hypothetical protein [Hymenobacter yonginensis]|uniref:ParB/Sulfiredoxin domain-containing protein n=1 Tax=Hymenobacter yonginensis TaxID=748197 RepID=A0ABY7PK20_9BACT|nr:hypothetical protein [Hymenobacter yonginensis]WBO83613.1 hypothetical protein O9Z63_14650 [Hymenobacter yonginensis]